MAIGCSCCGPHPGSAWAAARPSTRPGHSGVVEMVIILLTTFVVCVTYVVGLSAHWFRSIVESRPSYSPPPHTFFLRSVPRYRLPVATDLRHMCSTVVFRLRSLSLLSRFFPLTSSKVSMIECFLSLYITDSLPSGHPKHCTDTCVQRFGWPCSDDHVGYGRKRCLAFCQPRLDGPSMSFTLLEAIL